MWNHEIRFISGKQLTFELIYALFNKKLKILREYLKINERKEFIKKSKFSTKYSIFFVFKKNGELCLCVDYQKLNEITIKNRYSLFNIGELQDRLIKTKWFTKLNLRGVYNLIRMKKEEEWKTAFRTRYNLYEYTIMFFKLINVSTSCQKLFNNTLWKYLNIFVIIYLNDILIFFQTKEAHKKHVKKMLKCLNARNLLLKSEKCQWHKQKVDFLNYVVKTNEMKIDFDKMQSVDTWSKSINVKEL